MDAKSASQSVSLVSRREVRGEHLVSFLQDFPPPRSAIRRLSRMRTVDPIIVRTGTYWIDQGRQQQSDIDGLRQYSA